ncbi:MAG: hypothetical protein WCG99_04160 [Candidatus Berkelbacteria bacterium]
MKVALIISSDAARRAAIAAALSGSIQPVQAGCCEAIYAVEKIHRGNIVLVYIDACLDSDELSAPSHVVNLCGRTTYGPFVIGVSVADDTVPGDNSLTDLQAELGARSLRDSDKITIAPIDENLPAAVRALLATIC